ncbi:hypothetical protein IAT40_007801 [Kwoniella sp. CBS 6097]
MPDLPLPISTGSEPIGLEKAGQTLELPPTSPAMSPAEGCRTPSPTMPGAYNINSPDHINAVAGPSLLPMYTVLSSSSSAQADQPVHTAIQNDDNDNVQPSNTDINSHAPLHGVSDLAPVITTTANAASDRATDGTLTHTQGIDTANARTRGSTIRRDRGRRRRRPGRAVLNGIERFRKSWLCVIILKAVVAVAQVIALLTFLILASTLNSPLYSAKKQSQPSESCPRPRLFQAWMAVQLFRLTVCLSLSIWVWTKKRKLELAAAATLGVAGGSGGEESNAENGAARGRQGGSVATVHGQTRITTPGLQDVGQTERPSIPRTEESHGLPDRTPDADADADADAVPDSPSPGSTSTSVTAYNTPAASLRSTSSTSSLADQFREFSSARADVPSSEAGVAPTEAGGNIRGDTRPIVARNQDDPRRLQTEPDSTIGAGRRLEVSGYGQTGSDRQEAPAALERAETSGVVSFKLARQLRKWVNLLALILFILGNILVFKPLPSKSGQPKPTCYNASPMLWWGVMSVTAVGWALAAQLILWALLGILLGITSSILRRMGVLPPLPRPEPARPSRPAPLTKSELNKIGYVIYQSEDQAPSNVPTAQVLPGSMPEPTHCDLVEVEKRFAYPIVRLEESQATCGICQEDYVAPDIAMGIRSGTNIELLRKLGCGHIYHAKCIDQWLTKQAGNCPFCNRSVKEMIEQASNKKKKEEA